LTKYRATAIVYEAAFDSPMERNAVRRKICKFIRDTIAVLIQLRILAAELIFTVAAFYGIYHAFVLLVK
jgi:hypothetical protein